MSNNTFLVGNPNAGGGDECSRQGNLHYSLGAAVVFGGSTYSCSVVAGQDFQDVSFSGDERFLYEGTGINIRPFGMLGQIPGEGMASAGNTNELCLGANSFRGSEHRLRLTRRHCLAGVDLAAQLGA